MLSSRKFLSLVAGVMMSAVVLAQAPAAAPAGSTGMCRDGSYWSGATKKGACHGHKGVQDWYAGAEAPSGKSAAMSSAAPVTAAAPAAMPAAPAATPKASMPAAPKSSMPAAQAPGGGPGQVWVNSSSKVYHCSTDRWYGKTKNGEYMSESDAVAKGNHPDHGKPCK